MVKYERRRFLKISAAGAVVASVTSGARAAGSSQEGARKPMRLGLIVGVGNDPARAIAKVHELGVPTCQVGVDSFGPEMVRVARSITRMPLDVHLMCSRPEILLEPFVKAGADSISIHVELGDKVEAGQPLATIHAKRKSALEIGRRTLHEAITIGSSPAAALALVSHRVTAKGVEELPARR